MAKELMEIGGFITEGAEIVNHDASLSGNGTVDSPLGLNETVLWENWNQTNQTAGTLCELSESYKNFERVGILYDNMEFTGRWGYTEFPVSANVFRPPMTNFNDGLSLNIPWARWVPSGDNIYVQNRGLIYGTWTAPNNTSGDLRGYRIHQIRGINRKAQ